MTTLYVDRRNVEMNADAGALVFHQHDERIGTVPMAPLERIVLKGDVVVHSNLLAKLGERGIGIILLCGRKSTPTLFLPRAHNDAARRILQYKLSLSVPFRILLSRNFVSRKIQAQADLIQAIASDASTTASELVRSAEQIHKFANQAENAAGTAELRGIEGTAARLYFSALGTVLPKSLGFAGRNRRPPRDPFNAVLSLGYTLLHAETVLAVHAAGLDPFIGFYHELDFGRESLACDLMEELRPRVDRFAFHAFKEAVLKANDFSITPEGCILNKAGRERFYPAWEQNLDEIRARIRQTLRELLDAMTTHPDADPRTYS